MRVCSWCGKSYDFHNEYRYGFCSRRCYEQDREADKVKVENKVHKDTCTWCGREYEDGFEDSAGYGYCSKKCLRDAGDDPDIKAEREEADEEERLEEEKKAREEAERIREAEEKKQAEEAAARRTREFTQRAIEAFDAQQLDEAWECVKKASVSDLELNYRMVRVSKGVGLDQYFDDDALHKLLPRIGKKAEHYHPIAQI